jgi:Tol biopolymer transport system component
MAAMDKDSETGQVFLIPYPTGAPRRITADLNSYSGLSLSADSTAFVTTREETVVNIWTQRVDHAANAKQTTFGDATHDGWSGMDWTPDGRIVYSSSASGHSDIWVMDADGKNQKQLTRDLGSNFFGLSVSPNGRYIAFTSLRGGTAHIWRIDGDGRNPKQLTNGDWDGFPAFQPDGQNVRYRSDVSGKDTTVKISIEGGEPSPLDSPYQDIVGISPDGRFTAYIPPRDQSNKKRIAVAPSEGGEPIRIFDLPSEAAPRRMQWSPDSSAITYIIGQGRADNIWSQPIDGSPPKQLTDFKTSFIHCFAWSRDGKELAMARGTQTHDVVLIKNFR